MQPICSAALRKRLMRNRWVAFFISAVYAQTSSGLDYLDVPHGVFQCRVYATSDGKVTANGLNCSSNYPRYSFARNSYAYIVNCAAVANQHT